MPRRSGRRGGRRGRRLARRSGSRNQLVFLTQRGLVAQGTSVGASITSLAAGTISTTAYPLWFRVSLASTGKSFYQIQSFGGTSHNDMLQCWSGLISESTRTISGRYPRSIGGISSQDYSQNILEIDHPCMSMKESDDLNLYYHLTVCFRLPFPAVPDTCPAVNGTPRSSAFEMI